MLINNGRIGMKKNKNKNKNKIEAGFILFGLLLITLSIFLVFLKFTKSETLIIGLIIIGFISILYGTILKTVWQNKNEKGN